MDRKYPKFIEKYFFTADELWEALSPTRPLRKEPSAFIFRGQGQEKHSLIPSVLRDIDRASFISHDRQVNASDMIIYELLLLSSFVENCDALGITIPGDSLSFRQANLNIGNADYFIKNPEHWPNHLVLDVMAMAQHHGVPTRLLDWTTRPYVAAYFAASSAIARYRDWMSGDKLAVWALDIGKRNEHRQIRIHFSPGSTSRNLAAQGGIFTVQPHSGNRAGPFHISGLEDQSSDLPDPLFFKLTMPVFESARLLELCSVAGFNSATMFPSADGAGKAVLDTLNADCARSMWNKDEIIVRR